MKFDIVRAWKDEAYRQTLTTEQLSTLPANPAGEVEMSDNDLATISGGWDTPPSYASGHLSSTALVCELNVFTVNANVLSVPVNLLTGANSNCIGMH